MTCFKLLIAGVFLAGVSCPAVADGRSSASRSTQESYPTPNAAADALFEACRNNDSAALVRALGEPYREFIAGVDDSEEREHRKVIYEWSQELLEIVQDGEGPAQILIGRKRWPLPIPLVKAAEGWRFDTEAGMEEIRARRVGGNELAVMDVAYEYLRFQVEYAAVDRDDDQVREYAQRFVSTPGNRDGLYWEWDPESGEPPSPMEALLPDYFGDVSKCTPGTPYMGYYFKILTRQGANPPGGKYEYVINGNMIAGFALVAWPADYRASGVMTFVVSHQGKLLEKDLGPDTAKAVEAMTEYDPDASWALAKP